MRRPALASLNASTVENRRMKSCAWLIVLSWALVLILHRIPVGGYWLPIDPSVWLLLLAWVGAYILSYLAVASIRQYDKATPLSDPTTPLRLSPVIVVLALIGAVGAMAVVFDFAILRSYGFDSNVNAIRIEEVSQSYRGLSVSSPVSGAGRLMIPAIFIALGLAARSYSNLGLLPKLVLAGSCIVILYEQIAFEGGRIMIAAAVVTTLCAYFFTRPGRPALPTGAQKQNASTPWIRIAILSAVTLGFFLNVFAARILDQGGFFWSAYRSFSADFNLVVSVEHIARFEGIWGPFWFGVSMLWLYTTQGISEFDLLISQSNIPHSYGLYQFPQVTPISSLLLGANITYDFVRILPNTGTYLTIYGANWLDFGHGGAFVVAIALGILTAISMRRLIRGQWSSLALSAPLFFSVGIFAPVISVITTVWPAFFYAIAAAVILGRDAKLPDGGGSAPKQRWAAGRGA